MNQNIKYFQGKDNIPQKTYNINGLIVGLTSNGWLLQDIYYTCLCWEESYLIQLSESQLNVIQHLELKSNIYNTNN